MNGPSNMRQATGFAPMRAYEVFLAYSEIVKADTKSRCAIYSFGRDNVRECMWNEDHLLRNARGSFILYEDANV